MISTIKQAPNIFCSILHDYCQQEFSFPLIFSVLEGSQEGKIFWDGKTANYFVMHKFGFTELIELEPSSEFDDGLINFLQEYVYLGKKLRCYNVSEKWEKLFLNTNHFNTTLVERTQLLLSYKVHKNYSISNNDVLIQQLCESNFNQVEQYLKFPLSNRFWSSRKHFLDSSFGLVAFKKNDVAAICYACAIANGKVEVDIFTDLAYRRQGFGKILLKEFIDMCISRSLNINWDCYTNNIPSMSLANYFSFRPMITYTHAIISR